MRSPGSRLLYERAQQKSLFRFLKRLSRGAFDLQEPDRYLRPASERKPAAYVWKRW